MELATPVTLTVGAAQMTLEHLDPVWIDDTARRIVFARLHPALRLMVIYRGTGYDAIGDWTQAGAEGAVTAQLGGDPQSVLQSLVYQA